jgi:hypothetical protein
MVMTLQKHGAAIKSWELGGASFARRTGDLSNGLHDIETARRHYAAMRDLIIRHRGGSPDDRVLRRLLDLSRKAAAAIDDGNCRSLLSAVEGYSAQLFSESGHLKWARTEMSGAHFLRLQILRELDAFHMRLLQLQLEANQDAVATLAADLRSARR